MENSIEEITFVENKIKNTRRVFEEVGCYVFFDEDLCKAIEHLLSDYKKLQKENEELRKNLNEENKRCMMLAIEKQDYFEKYRYHLPQNESLTKEFSNVISVQKVKDKIEKEIKYHERNILEIENITMLKSKTAKEEAEIEFNKYAIVVLKKILQELIEKER